ncbi:MAG: tetratricopeptide repeat protein [bacterium]
MTKEMIKFHTIFVLIILLLFPLLSGKSQTVEDIVNDIRIGKFKQARESLLNLQLADQGTLLFLEGLLEVNGETSEKYYSEIVNNYPDSKYFDNALYRLAMLKYSAGLYKTATDYFNKILTSTSSVYLKQKCNYWLGLCYQAVDQENAARLKFSEVINKFPETEFSDMARLNLNHTDLQENNYSSESESNEVYAVQVGAFLNQQNAIMRKAFYENHSYRVELHTKLKNNKKFYLVWIGPYNSMSKARSTGQSLRKKFGQQYTIVTDKK